MADMTLILRALAVLPLLLLTACGGEDEPSEFTATGTVRIMASEDAIEIEDDECWMVSTRDEKVTVVDPDGTKVATGEVAERGVLDEANEALEGSSLRTCTFDFEVPNIPDADGIFTAQYGEDEELEFPADEASGLEIRTT